MANIPPIGDAYIDEIIKAIDPYDSSLNKTQGVKLRELVKLMRDRTEQEIALSMALQQSYTEVGDTNISVTPANYFDQPTTFIVNRNAGSDAIISFESYAAAEDIGKIYHIKNMGSIPAVLVSASGALFDGETSITLSQYLAVTIMSVNLTNGGAVSRWAIMSSKGKATDDVLKVLTLNMNGLPGNIPVSVNGVIWPGRQKSFPAGTVLQNLVVTAAGYTISPSSIPSVTVDEDKTLNFTATATGDDPVLMIEVNGLDDIYQVTVDGVVWTDNKKAFARGTVLENLTVRVEDYDLNPVVVEQVMLDSNKTLTFEATSQGFTHVDTQWDPAYGGGMQSDVSRVNNSLFNLTEGSNYIAFSAMQLYITDSSASIKCELHGGMMGVQKFGEDPGSQNRYAYAVKTESDGRIIAMSWPGHPYGTYVTLNSYVAPIVVEMEFTDTEVIWYHGDGVDKLEWHRVERLEFDYYLSAEVYTSIENIKQKGFTDSYDPDPTEYLELAGTPVTSYEYMSDNLSYDIEGNLTRNSSVTGYAALTLSIEPNEIGYVGMNYPSFNIVGEEATNLLTLGVGLDPHYGEGDSLAAVWIKQNGKLIYYIDGVRFESSASYITVGGLVRLRATLTGIYIEVSNVQDTWVTVATTTRPTNSILRSKINSQGDQFRSIRLTSFVELPVNSLIEDFEYIDFNNAVNVGENRKVVEGPAEVWSSNSNINENPLQVPYTLETDSIVAMGNASRGVKLGFIIGFNNLYNLIFCIRLTTAGLFQYEAYNTTTTDVSIQPTGDQFVGFRYAGSNNFEIGVIDLDGTFTVANTHNMGYDVFGQSDPVVIQAKVEEQPISKIYYPQGKNLTDIIPPTNDILLSGATRFVPPSEFTSLPTSDSTYRYQWITGGAVIADKQLIGEGYVAVRFEADSNMLMYLCINNNTGYEAYMGIRTVESVVAWEDNGRGGGVTPVQPNLGDYVGMRRLSDDTLEIFSTPDGISFTTLYTFGAASQPYSDFKYLVFETAGYGYLYDPQSIGLTNV